MSGSETLVERLRCNAREEMSLVDMLPTGPLRSLGEQKSKLCEEAAARIEELEAENAALQSEKDQLQDRADAYDVLQWLIGEGYHDFRWDYNSDTEILSLESSGLSVDLSLHELKRDSTMMTLRMLKARAAKETPNGK